MAAFGLAAGLSRLCGGRHWNANVGIYDVVEEVGHPELHRERDDLEDLRVYVSDLPDRLKVGVARAPSASAIAAVIPTCLRAARSCNSALVAATAAT